MTIDDKIIIEKLNPIINLNLEKELKLDVTYERSKQPNLYEFYPIAFYITPNDELTFMLYDNIIDNLIEIVHNSEDNLYRFETNSEMDKFFIKLSDFDIDSTIINDLYSLTK